MGFTVFGNRPPLSGVRFGQVCGQLSTKLCAVNVSRHFNAGVGDSNMPLNNQLAGLLGLAAPTGALVDWAGKR